jgi:hypothetical protein
MGQPGQATSSWSEAPSNFFRWHFHRPPPWHDTTTASGLSGSQAETGGKGQASTSRAVAQVRRASAATPCRTVRFTRSIKAVFNLPEKPNSCKAAARAASVKRRITCMTRVSLRQRSAFFHLAVDQARRHLPLSPFPTLEPLSKMSCQSIKVHI